MSTEKLDKALNIELESLSSEGRMKSPERVIEGYIAAKGDIGPRYRLKDSDREFIRLNSNSYLSLSNHPKLMAEADKATRNFGVGPGAVRFIDGTFIHHTDLEKRISAFVNKPAAKIFNSAYTSNCGLALSISNKKTHWIGDQLNHNSIIRAMRITNIPSKNKGIYNHNDMADLKRCLDEISPEIERVVVIFDGIFSMRGDFAPINEIAEICRAYESKFKDGIITVVDDSHGIGAYGDIGRGTPDYCNAWPDIVIGTFGKAFGVNGGFIAGSQALIECVRQKADTYIYTNPLSVADCAAAIAAIDICDSDEGLTLLKTLKDRTTQFRNGLQNLGLESIPGPHPVVPLMVRETQQTHNLVKYLYNNGVLVVGLAFPVVPKGDETIRFQVNACHTSTDINYVLNLLFKFK
ncbi:MAG: aminotransferase class I/II-fold pyridoxal phosphate-dependent enzyme [Desulfobacula sp.]|jgi:glycine C-acetyltransferase|uniref:aminotransferase class I/II-fold pyridoxal phosphate-dependent enzyme n=1 Tax=Desulfobacula sp. TaxID=2593537 RepID=UPI001DADB1F6|nr:aminotransferase class I/II-fold pyridoxal phosphate-dependent enzyme [Desulfobacula sp.]MBT3484935.1 aminotransferase class I/II-fold pyridoxal phosphate-dependent enzyme [Desulfobacula sp.]MBT3803229.1 aminotransferase class I/II-fold pyridoxal phosphate-dependent enzyme [Desulfobacula sp.]MBT4024612.1 aminotransferase class I/II-fold pyridoxal phosphate-dependent enzyme [Desulfobacula sp.]MBT4197564.1 aminotransferase class I/II-fold pyridoxal phosphate-dependent enzyme [Desulfobacula sp.